jgi:enolase-phosphatase E1
MKFKGSGLLLDVEGTTSSIRFVYDEMFPYVREQLEPFVDAGWDRAEVVVAREQIAADAGHSGSPDRQWVIDEVTRLMDGDVKATGLKQLQGLIWREGFKSGRIVAHVYDDVVPAFRRWREQGLDVRIYSSGSVTAQKLFFGHTARGDLRPLLGGHYDTLTGPKKEADSYRVIAQTFDRPPDEILFVSDSLDELEAAREAGCATVLSIRPENPPIVGEPGHPSITSFDQILIER